jgi:hypothetical protein
VIYKGKRLLHAALCANETDIICVCVRERERARAREKERNSERESERASERENVNACEIGLYVCVCERAGTNADPRVNARDE